MNINIPNFYVEGEVGKKVVAVLCSDLDKLYVEFAKTDAFGDPLHQVTIKFERSAGRVLESIMDWLKPELVEQVRSIGQVSYLWRAFLVARSESPRKTFYLFFWELCLRAFPD